MAKNDVKLPEIGEGVTEGELVNWLVKVGDTVSVDQPVAELMTDKATVEVPSTAAGVVAELKFKVGDTVKVENTLLVLDSEAAGSKNSNGSTQTNSNEKSNSVAAQKTAPQANQSVSVPASNSQGDSANKSQVSQQGQSSGGKKELKLPELGEGVTEGELVNWLVKPGDMVKVDQPLAELMTDKATVEVPSTAAGKVLELKFKVGDTVKVESVIVVLEAVGSASSSAQNSSAQNSQAQNFQATTNNSQKTESTSENKNSSAVSGGAKNTPPAQGASYDQGVYPPVADSRVLATPATRRLAREMNVDINQLSGSGLAGRVTREDVLSRSKGNDSAANQSQQKSTTASSLQIPKVAFKSTQANQEERVALRGIRKKIAENMQMAKHIVPHFTLMDEANVTALVQLREELKPAAEAKKVKITFLPFVMKALLATIREFPMFNASIDDAAQEIVYKQYFNVGFAADTPNGLLVPVIKNADQKTIVELSKEITELAIKARDGKLAIDEMKGATFTVTNIGSVGGTYATPIINHPEVAIFGMYKIQDRPVIENGELSVAKYMNFTVTCDHRLIDGAVAARFLTAFIKRIENPGVLMLDMI